ncbi:sterol 3-beta-glucosyltransferase isoform X2 [Ananas comosus]|uniref:Sterol 3-beta-glucosyltransferase isoform X2 n=1 Tax=Ananas comosus TaxID=4615 RepID=A0A6P5FN19_ANACO|nr:sterol 3-beta-glucosyltransferase isoform X2 [Ananas comosus]
MREQRGTTMESHGDSSEGRRPRAVFMAFGTKGDVFPVAAIAAAFACDQQHYHVVFITHSAHQSLSGNLSAKNITYMPLSAPPVLPAHYHGDISDVDKASFSLRKELIQTENRQECLSALEEIFRDAPGTEGDFIAINFFALEGWHLAELFQVQCVVTAPYVVPYSAPSSFERRFKQDLPLLYKYFQDAPANMVSWKDVIHWMWPLFMENWGLWRSNTLNLSPLPFTDPVTNLPLWHMRTQSPVLLYGFSKEIVECPGYWPPNAHICGFWFLPMEWQFSCNKCAEKFSLHSYGSLTPVKELCPIHADLQHFLRESMGFLRNPRAFLMVLGAVIETTNYKIIFFSSGYKPLDTAIQSIASASSTALKPCTSCGDSTILFNGRLFCFSGSVPYSWIFPQCAVAVHHAGSGTTAAALHAGIPQVVCPYLLDQFYWAEKLCWLEVAPEPLQRQHVTPDSDDSASIVEAAEALSRAIRLALTPEMKEQAAKIAERVSSEDGIGEALKVLKEKVASPFKRRKD